ncbi:unnamed protein product [Dracunculus medinensis]|uniref:Large ribosomal subunit protein P2 n=1 Tax=Dracunculus medinensis TaxID=318479 RepID=A0A0N4U3K0_DRAME|nr:unnamed protein product [Dracunculus medinensis]
MRYVAAYMLAAIGGRHGVSKIDIENILGAVGIDCDNEQAAAVVQKMSGKTIDELIANGSRYLAVVSSITSSATSDIKGAPAVETNKEEKKEEKEESDDDMGFGLFD